MPIRVIRTTSKTMINGLNLDLKKSRLFKAICAEKVKMQKKRCNASFCSSSYSLGSIIFSLSIKSHRLQCDTISHWIKKTLTVKYEQFQCTFLINSTELSKNWLEKNVNMVFVCISSERKYRFNQWMDNGNSFIKTFRSIGAN